MNHKYLFVEIDHGKFKDKKIFKTRLDGIKNLERLLNHTDDEVEEIIYHDERKHLQEFVCDSGSRYLLNRI